jgi:hypothetical protein
MLSIIISMVLANPYANLSDKAANSFQWFHCQKLGPIPRRCLDRFPFHGLSAVGGWGSGIQWVGWLSWVPGTASPSPLA